MLPNEQAPQTHTIPVNDNRSAGCENECASTCVYPFLLHTTTAMIERSRAEQAPVLVICCGYRRGTNPTRGALQVSAGLPTGGRRQCWTVSPAMLKQADLRLLGQSRTVQSGQARSLLSVSVGVGSSVPVLNTQRNYHLRKFRLQVVALSDSEL